MEEEILNKYDLQSYHKSCRKRVLFDWIMPVFCWKGGRQFIIIIASNRMSRENLEQQLRREITDLENQVYDLETFYLENTRDSGNLLKGFENYLTAKAPRNQLVKKPKIQNIQRLFSLTSIRSKTSEAIDETLLGDYKMDSSQIQPKRSRPRASALNSGKSYSPQGADEMSMENSVSYSVDESSNPGVKNRTKKKKIGKSSKGLRRP